MHRSAVLEHVFMRAQRNPDINVAVRSLLGTQVADDLEPTWGCAEPTRKAGLDFDDLPHTQWNEFVDKDVVRRAAKFPAEVDAVFAKQDHEGGRQGLVRRAVGEGRHQNDEIEAQADCFQVIIDPNTQPNSRPLAGSSSPFLRATPVPSPLVVSAFRSDS